MDGERQGDGFAATEEEYAGYTVYDRNGEKVGKVDDLFLDENDTPEYIGVKMGFLGTRSTLIPMGIATVDESNRAINVSADNGTVKNGPTFDDDREITPEYEREVLGYYGVDRAPTKRPGAGGHLLLGALTEGELASMAGRQRILPARKGSGLSDVSRDHDRYLADG